MAADEGMAKVYGMPWPPTDTDRVNAARAILTRPGNWNTADTLDDLSAVLQDIGAS